MAIIRNVDLLPHVNWTACKLNAFKMNVALNFFSNSRQRRVAPIDWLFMFIKSLSLGPGRNLQCKMLMYIHPFLLSMNSHHVLCQKSSNFTHWKFFRMQNSLENYRKIGLIPTRFISYRYYCEPLQDLHYPHNIECLSMNDDIPLWHIEQLF